MPTPFEVSVDEWVRKINRQFYQLDEEVVDLHNLSIENYHDITHLMDEIEELKVKIQEINQEINTIKFIQVIAINNNPILMKKT